MHARGVNSTRLLAPRRAQVYASNACQIIPPADAAIAAAIEAELALWQLPPLDDVASYSHPLVLDPLPAVADSYYAALKQHLHHRSAEANAAAPAMAYTALHGVGTPWLLRAFADWGLPPPVLTPRQCEPDPAFSTGAPGCSVPCVHNVCKIWWCGLACSFLHAQLSCCPATPMLPAAVAFPNPEEGKGAWQLAFQAAEAAGARLAIANDPDADRFAVAERDAATGEHGSVLRTAWRSTSRSGAGHRNILWLKCCKHLLSAGLAC